MSTYQPKRRVGTIPTDSTDSTSLDGGLPPDLADALAKAAPLIERHQRIVAMLESNQTAAPDLLSQRTMRQSDLGRAKMRLALGESSPATVELARTALTRVQEAHARLVHERNALSEEMALQTDDMAAVQAEIARLAPGYIAGVVDGFLREYAAAAGAFSRVISTGRRLAELLNTEIVMPPVSPAILDVADMPDMADIDQAIDRGALRLGRTITALDAALRANHEMARQRAAVKRRPEFSEQAVFRFLRDSTISGRTFAAGSLVDASTLPGSTLERLFRSRVVAVEESSVDMTAA